MDKVPKTAENFRQLCIRQTEGESYLKCPFHRVIPVLDRASSNPTESATAFALPARLPSVAECELAVSVPRWAGLYVPGELQGLARGMRGQLSLPSL